MAPHLTESFIIETVRQWHAGGDTPEVIHASLIALGYGTEAACTITAQALAH